MYVLDKRMILAFCTENAQYFTMKLFPGTNVLCLPSHCKTQIYGQVLIPSLSLTERRDCADNSLHPNRPCSGRSLQKEGTLTTDYLRLSKTYDKRDPALYQRDGRLRPTASCTAISRQSWWIWCTITIMGYGHHRSLINLCNWFFASLIELCVSVHRVETDHPYVWARFWNQWRSKGYLQGRCSGWEECLRNGQTRSDSVTFLAIKESVRLIEVTWSFCKLLCFSARRPFTPIP